MYILKFPLAFQLFFVISVKNMARSQMKLGERVIDHNVQTFKNTAINFSLINTFNFF